MVARRRIRRTTRGPFRRRRRVATRRPLKRRVNRRRPLRLRGGSGRAARRVGPSYAHRRRANFNRIRGTYRPNNQPHVKYLKLKSESEFNLRRNLNEADPHFNVVDAHVNVNAVWIPTRNDDRLGAAMWDTYQMKTLKKITWKIFGFRRNVEIKRSVPANTAPFSTPAVATVTAQTFGTPANPFTMFYDRGVETAQVTPSPTSLEDWSRIKVSGEHSHIWGSVNVRSDVSHPTVMDYDTFRTSFTNWTTFARNQDLNGKYFWINPNTSTPSDNNTRQVGVKLNPGDVMSDTLWSNGSANTDAVTGVDNLSFRIAVYTTWKLSKQIRDSLV